MSAASPSATTWWSSTMSTLVAWLFTAGSLYRRFPQGQPEFDGRAEAWLADDLVPAAREHRALGERQQSKVAREAVLLRDDKAASVVLHDSVDAAFFLLQAN